MNTLHSNPKAKPQKRMTGGFICALFLALIFSMASCSKDKNTGTIILRNASEHTIKVWVLHEAPSGAIHDRFEVTISRGTGENKRSGIPAGKYEIYVSLVDYPYTGGHSDVFEVKDGKTVTAIFNDVGDWNIRN